MIQATTALRKIARLRKKYRVVRGGQGSGKSISILIILINHAFSVPNREIFILSAELTKMRLTIIKDFVKIMKLLGLYDESRFIAGTLYRCPNGSFIKFIGLDKEDVGKGLRSDVSYFNEANKVDGESFRQVASRSNAVYIDYNPDAKFWVDEDVLPREDAELLQLTFEDNEALGESERNEILNYKKLGYNEDGTVKNEYWANIWQVYGLGNIGSLQGAVFPNWETIALPKDARKICTGVDFGYSKSKFAAVDVYKYNGDYIFRQLVYSNDLTNKDAADAMKRNGYTYITTYCDYAEPKSIEELRRCGIKAVPCESKSDIKSFAIKKLNEKRFYVTDDSPELENELRHYVWDEKTGAPKKSDMDHLMDAMIYSVGSEGKYTGSYTFA